MNKFALIAICVPVALGACSGVKKTLGMERNAPDEFAVVARAPLTMPPNFDLMPPEPGVARPQETTTATTAQGLILGSQPNGAVTSNAASSAESDVLSQASKVKDQPVPETDIEDESVAEKLGVSSQSGNALNADEEAKRLQQKNISTSVSPVMKNAK